MSGLMFIGIIIFSVIVTAVIIVVTNHFWPEIYHGDM
ncbi:hypothetical protein [Salmonella phage GSW6]|uniref:Uncharacterized protein n=1 Tax=Salmonella phage GSW6 TaxID=3025422 RepID=A0AAF0BYW6_9CAUD|nr:hypothetical protein [Salmonella phage GSW6]